MRLPACPQVLALIVLVSFVIISAGDQIGLAQMRLAPVTSVPRPQQRHRPIRQSPQSVNVRPRVTTPQPGLPAVKATANPKRVLVGELVTFTLTPANVVMDSRYKVTLYFGDGDQQVMSQTRIDHPYLSPRTYTYSILVELSGLPTPTPRPTPTPVVPGVKLSATPTQVEIDRGVEFTAQLSHSYPNLKYQFVFGDGAQTKWQDSQQTTHSYRSPGSFQAYVDLGLVVKQMGGSLRQAIKVTAPPPRNLSVDLTANKDTVQANEEVEFSARVDSGEPDVRYRFDFGDGSGPNNWQVSPGSKHVYSSAGAYQARVQVRVMNSRSGPQTASSKPLPIKVEPASLPGVNLSVTPQSVPAGLPVYFNATADGANSKTRYRFSFGDGSLPTDWTATKEATHIYSLAGDYPVFVEIGSAGNRSLGAIAASGKKRVQVLPLIPSIPATSTPSPIARRSRSPIGSESPTPDASPSVAPTPSPSPVLSGSPDTASPTPDGSGSPLNGGNTSSPTPDGSGSPLNGGDTGSPSPTPSPAGEPTPNPTTDGGGSLNNSWRYLLLLLIPLAGYHGWKYFYAPRPTLVPNIDPGKSALDTEGGPLSINYQVELDPNVTGGQFVIDPTEGSLIKSERKSDG